MSNGGQKERNERPPQDMITFDLPFFDTSGFFVGEGATHAGVEPRCTRLFLCLTFNALVAFPFASMLAPDMTAFSFPERDAGGGLKIGLTLTSDFGVAGPPNLGLRAVERLDLAGVDGARTAGAIVDGLADLRAEEITGVGLGAGDNIRGGTGV